LMVPIPAFLLDRIIHLLQQGSAWVTRAICDLFGVPASTLHREVAPGFSVSARKVDIAVRRHPFQRDAVLLGAASRSFSVVVKVTVGIAFLDLIEHDAEQILVPKFLCCFPCVISIR